MDPGQVLDVVGKKINPLISNYAKLIPFSQLWGGAHWPQGRRVFIIIPTSGSSSIILIYSVDAQGWTIYNLMSAGDGCIVSVADEFVYYSSNNGIVYLGETGYSDNGGAINYNGRFAFNFFGSRGNYKAFKDIRPLIKTLRGVTLSLGLDTNFARGGDLATVSTVGGTFTAWGDPWGSPWSSDVDYIFDRHAVRGQGHCAAIRVAGAINGNSLEFFGFEIRFDMGGQV